MLRRSHIARRLAVLIGAATLLVALAATQGVSLALELGPAVVLAALLVAGWMPGERRLALVLARRAARRRVATGPAPLVHRRGPRVFGAAGRPRSGARSSRGPPAVLAA